MWNFENLGNLWQMSVFWKNWGGGFGGLWGSTGQQPTAPTPAPVPVEPARPADQMETLNRIIDLARQLMPTYDYLTMQLSTALDTHKADCIAYSLFVKIACDLVGIPCDLIFCTQDVSAFMNGYHVFNRSVLDGVPYWSDTTYVNWGDNECRAFQVPRDGQAGMAAYYLIGTDGSTCELDGLNLNLIPKANSTYCMAASLIVGMTERNEYSKCKDRVAAELKKAGIL